MRHETCLSCQHPEPGNEGMTMTVAVGESLFPAPGFTHHHHTITCTNCGAWWFDDPRAVEAFRVVVVEMRDTAHCECPEEAPFYKRGIMTVMAPEDECVCTAASIVR